MGIPNTAAKWFKKHREEVLTGVAFAIFWIIFLIYLVTM